MSQPAGKGATVGFRFRNGRRVRFEAHEVLLPKLLSDVKEYLTSRTFQQIDWQRINLNSIGFQLVTQNGQQYLGRLVARWELDLEPSAGHFDKQITVSTPLQRAGAYFVTARMDGGNTSNIVLNLDDTVIVEKTVSRDSTSNAYYFVADSRTGQPVPGADVALFGWRMVQVEGKNEYRLETKNLMSRTDDFGQAFIPGANLADAKGAYQWLTTATTAQGRLAHLGFAYIWTADHDDQAYDQVRLYMITDRPVYRPGQPVRFKFWVARSRYDQPNATDFAHTSFIVEIYNPKGEKVLTKSFQTDAFGGFDGSFELPSDAALVLTSS